MNLINKYRAVIAIILTVLILISIRLLSPWHFKPDAKKWAEPSMLRSNIITRGNIGTLHGEKLIINLSNKENEIRNITGDIFNIAPDSVLSKKDLKIIKSHNGPILLISSETSVSARIWMLLSQKGCRNIYILTDDKENEVLKYKFRPDTITRPEL